MPPLDFGLCSCAKAILGVKSLQTKCHNMEHSDEEGLDVGAGVRSCSERVRRE